MKHLCVSLLVSVVLVAWSATPAFAEKGCGDVSKDTAVNSIDATIILQVDAGIYDHGIIFLDMWDPFDDDMITSRDALLVLQYDAGFIPALTTCYGP